ncbi:MAG: zinc metalloprotease [Aeromicrobium sp.]|uniref:zinc metalloprotease n=1 Tax=Aeromicrobium sp. TaxID=1871063 RepID=UPI003C3DEE85
MRSRSLFRWTSATVLVAGLISGASASTVVASPSPGAAECVTSAARVASGSSAKEPELYPKNEAKAYGVIKDVPRLPDASVTIPTVFHVVSDRTLSSVERARRSTMIADQMKVLNDSFAGRTADQASGSPFRFELDDITWTVNAEWSTVTPGKTERDMKRELHTGDSETLNVYAADIRGGLLGWAYFPKGYNAGRDYIDGVVLLDETMPGGTAGTDGKYALGDTLTHEVGHWLMLEHTFKNGCAASGDFVADTPREAVPQFNCPVGADTCSTPGMDPIHNFMDYTQDSCMDMFTPGQVERMSDAWVAFRAGGAG